MPEVQFRGLPFKEAAEFFRDKVRLPTERWTDIREGMHTRAFVVAGAMKDALLQDMQASIQQALDAGTTIEDFRKDFDQIVAKHGWTYRGGRNWRTRVIYQTNLRTASMAGRWQQMQRVKARRPYLRYVAVLDNRTRPDHRRWHGTVLHIDHEWWRTHYPPNDWLCRCTVQSFSEADLKALGYRMSLEPPTIELVEKPDPFNPGKTIWVDRGIGPGWNYNVGESAFGQHLSDAAMKQARSALGNRTLYEPVEGRAYRNDTWQTMGRPETLPAAPVPLHNAMPDSETLAAALKARMGAVRRAYKMPDHTSVALDAEVIARHLELRRTVWLEALFRLLEDPQEMWLRFERNVITGQVVLRKRLIGNFAFSGQDRAALIVAHVERGEFLGWTFIGEDSAGYVNRQRAGWLAWPAPTDRRVIQMLEER